MREGYMYKTAIILPDYFLTCSGLPSQTCNRGMGNYSSDSTLTVNSSFMASNKNSTALIAPMLIRDYYQAWNGSSVGADTPVIIHFSN